MNNGGRQEWIQAIRETAVPLRGAPDDYDGLLKLIGDAHFVLLGGATRGSYEIEHARSVITARLIEEKNFCAVALEADGAGVGRANRYVQWREGNGDDAFAALGDFRPFPRWMWRNYEMMDFLGFLRRRNSGKTQEQMVGVYGLDRLNLYRSLHAALEYLETADAKMAEAARQYSTGFELSGILGEAAHPVSMNHGIRESLAAHLERLRSADFEQELQRGMSPREKLFQTEQNARLGPVAAEFYGSLFGGPISVWNLRDHSMAESLNSLYSFFGSYRTPKIVVWAHNIHVGNALATSMSKTGQITMGQLIQRRYGREAVLVGFSTHGGTVTVVEKWGEEARRIRMRPALDGSYEALFHDSGIPSFFMGFRNQIEFTGDLLDSYPQRSIGAVYAPHREQSGHYLHAVLPEQFDALLHFDLTTALEPLDRTENWLQEITHTAEAF